MRFTRLRLENWRNFVKADVNLTERVFLVGPNAAGKSNFLDVFRFLHDVASPGKGGFQAAVGNGRGGVPSIRSLAARAQPAITIAVDVAADDGSNWTYLLKFNNDEHDKPVILEERIEKNGEVIRSRPNESDGNDPELLTQTHLEQTQTNKPFRLLAEFFASIKYVHVVPQLIRHPERFAVAKEPGDPFGSDLVDQIAEAGTRDRNRRLKAITSALNVAVPQLQKLELAYDKKGKPHLRGKYRHWRPMGAWQNEISFSDGTLRLLGFLWSLLSHEGPLLLEEPELSLHPGVIRYIPMMIARIQASSHRQVMASTHSGDILQDEGLGADEVLLLLPKGEGTDTKPAASFDEVRHLLEGGLSLTDAVIPLTRPADAIQLALFDEKP